MFHNHLVMTHVEASFVIPWVVGGGALSLQETSEFFNGETGLANDGTKSTPGYFFVPRDSKPTMRRIVVSQDDVTAV